MRPLARKGFVWQELMTSPNKAERFYAEVVGIEAEPMGQRPDAYRLATFDGNPVGGFVVLDPTARRGRWGLKATPGGQLRGQRR